jgi:hypothetical protein
MTSWLRRCGVFALVVFIPGCLGGGDEGLISSTNSQLGDAAGYFDSMTASLKDFLKHKEANDDKTAKDDAKAAAEAAAKLKAVAKQLQSYYRQSETAGSKRTEKERDEFRQANQSRLAEFANKVADLSERDREFRATLAQVTKKYTDAPVQDLLKELREADSQFASITRKR